MTTNRLEAFSDGVMAIIITIMVLELKVPAKEDTLESFMPLISSFLSYILSFIYLGIYWNNHHNLLKSINRVNGWILWNNMHLLFWLSLIPFTTGWIGENYMSPFPVLIYGFVLFMSAIAYTLLLKSLIKAEGPESKLAVSIGKDIKGKLSVFIYLMGISFAFLNTWLAISCYIVVAGLWFVPDKRMETAD